MEIRALLEATIAAKDMKCLSFPNLALSTPMVLMNVFLCLTLSVFLSIPPPPGPPLITPDEGPSLETSKFSLCFSGSFSSTNESLSPSRRREAPCEGSNSPRLFTPGETKALAKSKVHQLSRAWVTHDVGVLGGWSS